METNIINLENYYTCPQAVEVLSRNSGHKVDANYPRTLARYKRDGQPLVRTLDIGSRLKLYLKADIDNYVVSATRGRKRKEKPPAPVAPL